MPPRIRLKDIGAHLALDKSTVSLALRGDPRIAEATRARVVHAATALGYRRDPALSRLAQVRWANRRQTPASSIAMVSWAGDDYPDQARELSGPLRAAIEGMGYGWERIVVTARGGVAAAARILRARGVDGLVALASRRVDAWHNFPWADFCGVEILTGGGRPSGLATIRQDTIGALVDAGQRIAAQRPASAAIVLIQQDPPSLTDDRDEAAALLVLKRWAATGIRVLPLQIVRSVDNELEGLGHWLATNRPACLIYPNNSLGYLMSQVKLAIPTTTRVIVHRRHGAAQFAGYEQPLEQMAQLAAQHVDSLVRSGQRGLPEAGATSVVPVRWVDGPSFPQE
jgi:DNA-binding LacI/PurR family transcriptional regulator